MRTLISSTLILAGLLLAAPLAIAGTANCPVEPASNTPIASGNVFAGANCALYSRGDVDSFVFNANSGDEYHIVLAIYGAATTDICLNLYDPNGHNVANPCTSIGYYHTHATGVDQTLSATGTYTIVVSEASGSGAVVTNYALNLEREFPAPTDAQQLSLGRQVAAYLTPLSDSNAFAFDTLTTGKYLVSATLPQSASNDLCLTVYLPTGSSQGTQCTSIYYYHSYTVQTSFTPPENGTSLALFQVGSNDGTDIYTVEVSCEVGTCTPARDPGSAARK